MTYVHPIAAQGLNLALYETVILANHLEITIIRKLIIFQQNISMNVSHRLVQLFQMDFFGINLRRQFGMVGLDLVRR